VVLDTLGGQVPSVRRDDADEPVGLHHGIVSRGQPLPDFAHLVCHHAGRRPTDPRTTDRVLIAQLWEHLPSTVAACPSSSIVWVLAHRRRLLQLAGAERGPHRHSPDVLHSETRDGPLVFHRLVLRPLPSYGKPARLGLGCVAVLLGGHRRAPSGSARSGSPEASVPGAGKQARGDIGPRGDDGVYCTQIFGHKCEETEEGKSRLVSLSS
jgi:hypothetical protein